MVFEFGNMSAAVVWGKSWLMVGSQEWENYLLFILFLNGAQDLRSELYGWIFLCFYMNIKMIGSFLFWWNLNFGKRRIWLACLFPGQMIHPSSTHKHKSFDTILIQLIIFYNMVLYDLFREQFQKGWSWCSRMQMLYDKVVKSFKTSLNW